MDRRRSFFPVFFPSLFLLAAVGAPGLDGWSHHREVFGSENYYLTVLYSGSPDGVLSPGKPVRFSGSIVTNDGEHRVYGIRKRQGKFWVYELSSTEGTYVGRVQTGSCPQYMDLTPSASGQKSEKLRSGVCL
jgi:hypothetical protein